MTTTIEKKSLQSSGNGMARTTTTVTTTTTTGAPKTTARLSRSNHQRNKYFSYLKHRPNNAIDKSNKTNTETEEFDHDKDDDQMGRQVDAAQQEQERKEEQTAPTGHQQPVQPHFGPMKQFLATYFNLSSTNNKSITTNNTPIHRNVDQNLDRATTATATKNSSNSKKKKCISVPATPVKSLICNNNDGAAVRFTSQSPPKVLEQQHQQRKQRKYFSWLNIFNNNGSDSGCKLAAKQSTSEKISNKILSNNISINNNSNSSDHNNASDVAAINSNNKSNHDEPAKESVKNSDSGKQLAKRTAKRSNVKIIVDTLSKEVQTEEASQNNSTCNNLLKTTFQNLSYDSSAQRECPMSTEKFREHGRNLIDYISNYLDTIDKRRVTPLNIEPGYLRSLLDVDAPKEGEKFEDIMKDFENHIMCGITHWQHPRFHAYFPAGNAYASILADMLSDAIGCVGFSWAASPACTELEIIMLDWMGKMIGLPEEFLCLSGAQSKGGGVIQGSASECVLVNLLAARHVAIDKLRKKYPQTPDGVLLSKLIGYCSKEAHSCVEKAAMIGFIKMRALETDEKYSLRGEILSKAIKQDKANGLEPFLVSATLGTTSCCSFDNLEEVGRVCQEHDIWLHVDAAYAGSALICPEFKYLMKGIELATSFNMNPNKWMLINFDCSLMWVKDRFQLTRAFVVDPLYLQHSFSDKAIDYRHWGIPLSRRFRALKLWFVIRNYGVEGLQRYIRNHVALAKKFESLIRADSRFEIITQVVLGLVCFRLVGSNALNQRLLSNINASGKLHMVPASLNGRYIIRFCVCSQEACDKDVIFAYQCISEFASDLFESIRAGRERIRAVSQQNTIDVSDISLHTQQSASADLGLAGSANHHHNMLISAHSASTSASATSATGPIRGAQTPTTITGKVAPIAAASANSGVTATTNEESPGMRAKSALSAGNTSVTTTTCSPNSVRTSPMMLMHNQQQQDHQSTSHLVRGASSKLLKQRQQQQPATNSNNDASPNISEVDEDLEEELILDNSSCLHDDIDDDEDLGALLLSDEESKSGANEAGEAVDEVFTLEKKNKMSLRYKRGFFVRVVSDPKMYRVSISGDIGHSSGSIGSAGS